MKRITLFSVAAVLLLTGTASADLMVYEYVAGEKVTLDTVTGKYWYWNLNDFASMTYDQQITAIGGISPTYGNIAGGWQMASSAEIQALWLYSETDITSAFLSAYGTTDWPAQSIARYESIPFETPGLRYMAGRWDWGWYVNGTVWNYYTLPQLSAWVTTDANVVPAPPAVVLATTGFLTLLGAKLRGRWRRR